MAQDHKEFPDIARLVGQMVHNNGGTAGRNFAGIADPEADIMRLLDEVLGSEGIYYDDLAAFNTWLATLSEDDFDTVSDGEETDMQRVLATAPAMGGIDGSAEAFLYNVYEHCI